MITTKIEKLQQMANFEGDVRDGNIGSFSQGVVAGERNASKLALEVIEEILNKPNSQVDFSSPIYKNLDYGNSSSPPLPPENDKPKPSFWKPDSTKSMG